jgi:hypothetical protein
MDGGSEQKLDYERPRPAKRAGWGLLIAALAIGGLGNLISVWAASSLWDVPRGSAIRPMGLAAFLFAIATGTFVIGLPLSFVSCLANRSRLRPLLLSILALLASLSPYFSSMAVWKYITWSHGLIMEP